MKYPVPACRSRFYSALAAGLLTSTITLAAEQTTQSFDIPLRQNSCRLKFLDPFKFEIKNESFQEAVF
jgi:hypothetical protein